MQPIKRFDDQTKAVLAGAYQVSRRFNHAQVDAAHYLLALLDQTDGMIPKLFERLAVDLPALRAQVEALLQTKPQAPNPNQTQVFVTPQVEPEFSIRQRLRQAIMRSPPKICCWRWSALTVMSARYWKRTGLQTHGSAQRSKGCGTKARSSRIPHHTQTQSYIERLYYQTENNVSPPILIERPVSVLQ